MKTKILFILLSACLFVLTERHHQIRHSTVAPPAITGASDPQGINHTIDNSLSELESMQPFEKKVDRFLKQWELDGASIAIMRNGKLLYSKGFGWADREQNVRCDVRHIFRIASLSKLITATGIMKLCESGALRLDSKVFGPQGILNDTSFCNFRDKRVGEITVEELLRHEGGFSIRAGDPLFVMPTVARQLGCHGALTLNDMVRFASRSRLRFSPGNGNAYSNLGYVVLSKVIEKASGMPYEKYIQDSILHPIGCLDMHIGYSSYEQRFPNEVHYHEPSDTEPVARYDGSGQMGPRCYGGTDLQILSGAGGWVASPTELMKFITAIDPDDAQPDILKPSSIARMISTDKSRYPIGWMKTSESNDWTRTGSLSGSSAMIKRQHNGFTWVFVTNSSSWPGSRFTHKIAALMSDGMQRVENWPDRDLFHAENSTRQSATTPQSSPKHP